MMFGGTSSRRANSNAVAAFFTACCGYGNEVARLAARPAAGRATAEEASTHSAMAFLSFSESHWCVGIVRICSETRRADGKGLPSNMWLISGISLIGVGYARLKPNPRRFANE